MSNTEVRKITGAELAEAYNKQNEQLEKIIKNRERQLEYINNIPESQEKNIGKDNNGEDKYITVTKESVLRSMAEKEAINAITNGEYKKKLQLAKELSDKKKASGLTEKAEDFFEKTKKRLLTLQKYSRHPDQANVMKNKLEYYYNKNCTEQGINETITENIKRIENNKETIAKLSGLENTEFTINIKHDKSIGKLQLDEGFTTQLNDALAAKSTQTQEKSKSRSKKKGQEATM